jgi:SAM-dependent methyltransferase
MLRYIGASAVANAFSATPATRRSYRRLANGFETWRRSRGGLPEWYLQRVRLLVSCVEHNLELAPGGSVLEIGTGYVHWESLILSLISDVSATMVDVVDNRLFSVFKQYVSELGPHLEMVGLPPERIQPAHALVRTVRDASSFDEVYAKLSWKYVLNESGTMEDLPENSFDFVVSSDVLEHIDRAILPSFIEKMFRLMRPGAYSYHSIGLRDHLSNYDPKAPAKCYYRMDGATWDRWVNSKVQYINRVQRPEWLALFRQSGFECISEEAEYEHHGITKVHPSYSHLTQLELDTNTLMLVFRKPRSVCSDNP